MLKPAGPKIDAGGKMVKPTSALKWSIGKNGKMAKRAGRYKMAKMLKPTGPKIDAGGKMVKPLSAIKR